MASGIRDKVAILGMGCSRFGERWDCGADELMLEAFDEALADAGSAPEQIEAAWLGVCLEENNVGKTAGPLAQALRLPRIAATRVENACATGTEALRGAAYAVAAGAYDIVLALGVEKLKDTGYGGLPVRTRGVANDLWLPNATRARRVRAARLGLCREARRRDGGPEAGDGARLGEEPRQRARSTRRRTCATGSPKRTC